MEITMEINDRLHAVLKERHELREMLREVEKEVKLVRKAEKAIRAVYVKKQTTAERNKVLYTNTPEGQTRFGE